MHNGTPDTKAPRVYTCSNGVVLRLRPVPALLINDITTKFVKKPQVPTYENEGGRLEENPSDPAYVAAINDYNLQIQEMSTRTLLIRGTQPLTVPSDIENVDDKGWSEELEALGIVDIPVSGVDRRYYWLKYYVLEDANDLSNLLQEISVASGLITEESVQQAAESFRDIQTRDTNLTIVPTTEG